jgi:hypothetical protein
MQRPMPSDQPPFRWSQLPLVPVPPRDAGQWIRRGLAVLVPLLVAGLLWRAGRRGPARAVLLVALVLLVLSALPRTAGYVAQATGWLSRFTGRALTVVTLSFFYLIVLTPISLVQRLRRGDPLSAEPDATRTSYWEVVPESPTPLYRRQFAYEPPSLRASRRAWVLYGLWALALTLLLINEAVGCGRRMVNYKLSLVHVADWEILAKRQGRP